MKGSCLKYFATSLLCSIAFIVAEPIGKCGSTNGASVEFLTDSKDCSIFYQCDWGNPVKFNCAVGLYFNSKINVCDWPYNVNCDISENNTTEREVTDSNHFTTQNTNFTTEHYVSTTEVTDDEFVTKTSTVNEITTHNLEGCLKAICSLYSGPPVNVTFFPHDTDCERYCMCDWYGVAHDMVCPDGLQWNSVLSTCDWPWKVECEYSTQNSSINSSTEEESSTEVQSNTDSNGTEKTTTENNIEAGTTANQTNTTAETDPEQETTTISYTQTTQSIDEHITTTEENNSNSTSNINNTTDIQSTTDVTDTPYIDDQSSTNYVIETTTSELISPGVGCISAKCPLYPISPANVTYFPHDTNCTRYCMCDWYGVAHDMVCPDNLRWNSALDTCDWLWNVECESVTDGSSTNSTTGILNRKFNTENPSELYSTTDSNNAEDAAIGIMKLTLR